MNEQIIKSAQKSFIGLKNPYGSVEKVYPNIIKAHATQDVVYYVGVKNSGLISPELIKDLCQSGFYLHTIDKASIAGRAVDMTLKNPYTGRPMTGSSSGTAINVLLGINDIGIGTDGGGSVLAPAMSVNLIGFVSPLIDKKRMQKSAERVSTDGISFCASLGVISKHMELIKHFLMASIPELTSESAGESPHVICDKSDELSLDSCDIQHMDLSFRAGTRQTILEQLPQLLRDCDMLISKEGPIDLDGIGDSVLGHHDKRTLAIQQSANKGFVRAVNMAGATAVTLPTEEFATGRVLICESTIPKIRRMLVQAEKMVLPNVTQFDRYFCSSEEYYPAGFWES